MSQITNSVLPEQQNQANFNYFYQFTLKLNKISCVSFALYAAKLTQNSEPQEIHCLKLVENWLKNPNSVTKTELSIAANALVCLGVTHAAAFAAHAITYYAVNAAWTGSYAVTAASATNAVINSDDPSDIKNKLLNYLGYLLPKEPKLNNFNIDLLKQNQQAYSFLEKVSKLEDWQVTDEDLFGIRQIFDVLEEIGAPLGPNEFIWDGDVTEKHKLLQAIRREFL